MSLDDELLSQMRQDFLVESQEILDRLGPLLTQLEKGATPELINTIFREAHTLKGTAGFIGLEAIRQLAHKMEDVFGAVRAGKLPVTPELIDIAFASLKALGAMREDLGRGGKGEADVTSLIHQLEAAAQGKMPAGEASSRAAPSPHEDVRGPAGEASSRAAPSPREDVRGPAGDDSAKRTDRAERSEGASQARERPSGQSSERPVPRFPVSLPSPDSTSRSPGPLPRDPARAERPLKGISDGTGREAGAGAPSSHEDVRGPMGEASSRAVSSPHEGAQGQASAVSSDTPPMPTPVVSEREALAEAGPAGPQAEATPAVAETTLRVDIERLDTLMLLVGELITTRNTLLAITERLKDEQLEENAASITRLTRQLQNAVTAMRLVPIDRLFNRFAPVVRNLARERGKQVRLMMEGGDTLLDRSVSEQMVDPLMHMLRNAIDHGLEPTPDRRRQGKPEESTIQLSAERRGDNVILRVTDDGAGIDPNRLRRVAVERGLLSASEAAGLSAEQAVHLIFMPGFSTASAVTDLSGRGVGMDVVLENVRRLRGSIEVETHLGQSTTFVIQLPLTLAILQVLLARVGNYLYALPLHLVRETLTFAPQSIQTMQHGQVLFIRNVALPLRYLHELLSQAADPSPNGDLKSAVVVHLARGDEVIVVDELIGKQQMVIKPLGPYLGTVPGVEGAAILPDGAVTLILDINGLMN